MPLYVDYFGSQVGDDKSLHIESSYTALRKICEALIFEDRIEKILPFLLDMLKDDTDEEKRCSGLQILDCLADLFGDEVCSNYLIFEIVSLQEDPLYKVRKECCKNLVSISKVVNDDVFVGVMVPVFKKLCCDHIWGVRK